MDNANDSALALVDSILSRLRRAADGDEGYNGFAEAFHGDIGRVLEFSKRLELKAVAFADVFAAHREQIQHVLVENAPPLQHDLDYSEQEERVIHASQLQRALCKTEFAAQAESNKEAAEALAAAHSAELHQVQMLRLAAFG